MFDETELEARACVGDPSAFGRWIRLHDGDLRGVVWSVVRSADATDDVMQLAYEKAFGSIGSFDRRSSLKTWLHSICYRTAIDHLRHESYRAHEPIGSAIGTKSSDSPSSIATDRVELDQILDGLAPERRAMLMLTAGLGYSFDETAQILGHPRGTVASTVGRIRQQLSRWEQS